MLNQDVIREATRLTRAGQLVQATTLLQRMLRGDSARGPTPGTARTAPAKLEPPTIDAKATVVGERESRGPARAASTRGRKWSAPLGGMGEFPGLDLRGPVGRAALLVPGGGSPPAAELPQTRRESMLRARW